MSATDTTSPNLGPPTPEEIEALSRRAYRLANRLGQLAHRTLNLYEANLEVAEAQAEAIAGPGPAPVSESVSEHPAQPTPRAWRAPHCYTPQSTASNFTKATGSTLNNVKILVHAMESLLRVATMASKLEQRSTWRENPPLFRRPTPPPTPPNTPSPTPPPGPTQTPAPPTSSDSKIGTGSRHR